MRRSNNSPNLDTEIKQNSDKKPTFQVLKRGWIKPEEIVRDKKKKATTDYKEQKRGKKRNEVFGDLKDFCKILVYSNFKS